MSRFSNKKIAILGLGVEGLAVASFLVDKAKEITVFDKKNEADIRDNFDQKILPKLLETLENSKIKKVFEFNVDDLNVKDFDIIFRSPSFYFNHPKLIEAKKAGVEVSTQMKLFFELCPCKIVGVTGTKGKGTTSSLISEILKAGIRYQVSGIKGEQGTPNIYLAGNIGNEVLGLLDEIKSDDIVVLELSNFQLADLDKSPHIAVVTNLGIDHLDYHESVVEYHAAKESILRFQGKNDVAILNLNSMFAVDFIEKIDSKIEFFSGNESDKSEAFVRVNDQNLNEAVVRTDGGLEKICDETEIKLLGRHNLENIAAATLAALACGSSLPVIRETVSGFTGLPYRLEFVAKINDVTYINDSFATNPGPTMAAINSFSQNKILILGGSSKGADFSEMAEIIATSNVSAVLLIGVEGEVIGKALEDKGYRGKMLSGFADLDEVVTKAINLAEPKDVVIFSPACASFDMFKNYKDRGEKFKEAVLKKVQENE